MGQPDTSGLDQLDVDARQFELELRSAGLASASIGTYMKGVEAFLRWRRGDFNPKGPSGGTGGKGQPMDVSAVSWEAFLNALVAYRDRDYLAASRISGEHAYLAVFQELAPLSIEQRALHADSLIVFLNRWACRFPTKTSETRDALRGWIEREAAALEVLEPVDLSDPTVSQHLPELGRLYASLLALREAEGARIPTMGAAAASKILHLMLPSLFVMWDNEIKRGYADYGEFLLRMRAFALRLRDELAPVEARADVEGYLQQLLGYSVRKPLAKFIDEFNWWLAWNPPSEASRET